MTETTEQSTEPTFVTAYLTKSTPDEDGNYYVPVLVPSGAQLALPITDITPDDSLGGKGLKFDWSLHKWQVSDTDPTQLKIDAQNKVIADQGEVNTTLKTQLAGLLKQQALEQLGGAE